MPRQYFSKHSFTLMCGKYWFFLGMTNTKPNLLSLGWALCYRLLVIYPVFTKCRIRVAAFSYEQVWKSGERVGLWKVNVALMCILSPPLQYCGGGGEGWKHYLKWTAPWCYRLQKLRNTIFRMAYWKWITPWCCGPQI